MESQTLKMDLLFEQEKNKRNSVHSKEQGTCWSKVFEHSIYVEEAEEMKMDIFSQGSKKTTEAPAEVTQEVVSILGKLSEKVIQVLFPEICSFNKHYKEHIMFQRLCQVLSIRCGPHH